MRKETPKRRVNKKKFVLNAIHKLRKPGYLGMHVVYSGFNNAFRDYYGEDPIKEVDKLVVDGTVIKQPVKGGVMLYDPAEYKERSSTAKKKIADDRKETLRKILGE